MIIAKLRKSGNSFIVTVPREEVERLRLKEGQPVTIEVRSVELRPRLQPELQEVFDEIFPRAEPGLRYLTGR